MGLRGLFLGIRFSCHQPRDGSGVLNSHLPVVDLHGNYSTSCPFSIGPALSSSPFVDSICTRKLLGEISLSSFDQSQQQLCSLFSLVVISGFEPKAIPALLCSLSNFFWFNMSDAKTPARHRLHSSHFCRQILHTTHFLISAYCKIPSKLTTLAVYWTIAFHTKKIRNKMLYIAHPVRKIAWVIVNESTV